MPMIGRPVTPVENKFNKISMAAPGAAQVGAKKDLADELNSIAGIKKDSRFVDAKKHNKMGKDEFMKLLAHQLAHQDPLKPVDQKEFASDLAQFASLEQLTNMNQNMEKMQGSIPMETKFYAASFIGKQVTTSGTTLEFKEDRESIDIPFTLPKSAKNVVVSIHDSHSQLIKQIEMENVTKGNQMVTWDTTGMDGHRATKDNYTVSVRAWDESMGQFNGETKTSGVVTGVHFENGETVLTIDGKKNVFLRDVDSFQKTDENGFKKAEVKNTASDQPQMEILNNLQQKQAADAYNKMDNATN